MSPFKGVIPYLPTPIDEGGDIKRSVLAKLCRDLL
jgi:dihydrodipicolinate synthase/N-acetylneuraminate lyase